MTNNAHRRPKVFIYGDFRPTGFGRINTGVGKYLHSTSKYELRGACIQWDGIMSEAMPPMPFEISPLNGRDQGQGAAGYAQVVANIINAWRPDVLVSTQDFPYHEALRAAPIDWSVMAHIVITPIDGVPVAPHWLGLIPQLDGFMTISEFGVKALRDAGHRADLCPPGVDTGEFSRLDDPTRAALRDKLGIPHDGFVAGVVAMNQGRKDFPSMIRGFAEAFRDVPEAYLYLDCDPVSPMGWHIPDTLLRNNGLDPVRVRFRADAMKAGIVLLNERYNLLDLHMVLAHREGYGLPHGEAMATGCPSVSNDYCSGPELIGKNERGWLIPSAPPHPGAYGTWGGAMDVWPDMGALTTALREAYEKPAERLARGERGLEWVKAERTWERSGQAVDRVLGRVLTRRAPDLAKKHEQPAPPMPPLQSTIPAGITQQVIHVHGPVTVNGDNGQEIVQQLGALPMVGAVGGALPAPPSVESDQSER
jgi:glycosyltransferase involved in cell wall biosynthesis